VDKLCLKVGTAIGDDADFFDAYTVAHTLSELWHQRKPWVGLRPYSEHYDMVEGVLSEFGFTPFKDARSNRLQVAARMHDALEDAGVSKAEIDQIFGSRVADLVDAVTLVESTNVFNEADNQAAKLATLKKVLTDPDGVILKLADRIANFRSYHGDGVSPKHYIDDYKQFKEILYKPGQADAMWKELDRLVANSPQLAKEKAKK